MQFTGLFGVVSGITHVPIGVAAVMPNIFTCELILGL